MPFICHTAVCTLMFVSQCIRRVLEIHIPCFRCCSNDIVPVVMGAAPEDYRKVAPPHSYIHVDDFASPRELAAYLHKLDANDILYNEYFRWKGTGHFINTKFWCRVCAMAHAADRHAMWYEDVKRWWSGKDVCIYPQSGRLWASWRDMKRRDTDRDGTNIRHVTL